MSGTASGTTSAASLATVISFMPLGVPSSTFAWGCGFFLLGVAARAGGILFKKLDGNTDVGAKDFFRPLAATLCMIPVAIAASCVVFLASYVSNIHADAGCDGALLVMGLRGLEGFQWIVDSATNIFTKFIPGQKPPTGGI